MKKLLILALTLLSLAFLGTACKKSNSGTANAGGAPIDTAALEAAFKDSDAATQEKVAKVVEEIKGKDYKTALMDTRGLLYTPNLTESKITVINDTMDKIGKNLSE